ncbi:MAG TPA: BamA/TamA family outer membrane protein [Blastocatellia bacterium]|nr:BamA/TamA family outer membrane protein [Blastocatellia bacterium]
MTARATFAAFLLASCAVFAGATSARADQPGCDSDDVATVAGSAGADASASFWDGILVAPPPAPTPGQGPSGSVNVGSRKITFTNHGTYVPAREDRTIINFGLKHVNAVFGGLEQGAHIGLGVELTTADSIKWVELSGTAIVSFKLYRRFEVGAYFPKIGDEKTHARVTFDYLRRTEDNFFGIGPRTSESDRTDYDRESRTYGAAIYRDFVGRLTAGVYATIANTSIYAGQSNDYPSTTAVFSGSPSVVPVTLFAPGLDGGSRILEYGVGVEYDARDDSRGLTRGAYLFGRLGTADGLDKANTFSDFGWLVAEVDGRAYVPLGGDRTSFAVRGTVDVQDPKGGSQIPFYDMAYLGGRRHLRGFNTYRFRGNSAVLFSAELRRTVWAQEETKGVDVFAFNDSGAVWGDNRSTTNPTVLENDELRGRNWRFGFGGGVQYRYSKDVAVRIELAQSNEKTAFYFSISRGF